MMASVVLNGARSSARSSAASRARIQEAAARLGYRRNAAAVGLARRKMDTLGVVTVIDGGDINLYFHEVLNGILEAASEHRQNTTLFSIRDWNKDDHRILDCCDGRIDGMILVSPLLTPEFAAVLPTHTPCVTIHSSRPVQNTHNLDIDNYAAAYDITRYLIDCGHRDILHISGGHYSGANERAQGFLSALKDARLPSEDSRVIPGTFTAAAGREIMTDLLRRRPSAPLPSAIFCGNDAIALGCMEVLSLRSVRVPEVISVVGFDDTLMARMTHPALTTVRQPLRSMGRRAVEILLEAQNEPIAVGETAPLDAGPASHNRAGQAINEILPVELVIRQSVRIVTDSDSGTRY